MDSVMEISDHYDGVILFSKSVFSPRKANQLDCAYALIGIPLAVLPIVLGEVGLYNVGGFGFDENALAALRCYGDAFDRLPLRPCNAFSISSSTGIPRETVRRKVSHLIQNGWISRDAKGGLTITAKAAALCLQPFDDENLPDFIATADRVRTVMMRAAA